MHDLVALASEQHQDCVEQADKRPGGDVFEKLSVVPLGARKPANSEAGDDCSAKWDAEEGGDADRNGGVGDCDCRGRVADDVDEKDGQGRIEHHLQSRVDGHKDCAVLIVAAGDASPYQNLRSTLARFEGPWTWAQTDHCYAACQPYEDQAFA